MENRREFGAIVLEQGYLSDGALQVSSCSIEQGSSLRIVIDSVAGFCSLSTCLSERRVDSCGASLALAGVV